MDQHPVGSSTCSSGDGTTKVPETATCPVFAGRAAGRKGAIVVEGSAVLAREQRSDTTVETPQGEANIGSVFGLGVFGDLLVFELQGGDGGPAETACDESGDGDIRHQSATLAANSLHGGYSKKHPPPADAGGSLL